MQQASAGRSTALAGQRCLLWLYSRRVLPPYVNTQVRLACSRGKACTAEEGGLPALCRQSLLTVNDNLSRNGPDKGFTANNAVTLGCAESQTGRGGNKPAALTASWLSYLTR